MNMDRSNIVSLIHTTAQPDERGVMRDIETSRTVFANVKSATSAEFFKAKEQGLKAAFVFTIWSSEYDGEEIVEFNNQRFQVYRTYITGNGNVDCIELHCQSKVGV